MSSVPASSSSASSAPVALPPTMRVFERGWLSSNGVLLFDDAEHATLVDSGYVTHAAQTLALVDSALGGRRLRRVVSTHLHSDHCGGNAALKQRHGAQILIPPGQAAAVRAWDEAALSYAATGQQCERFDYDALLRPGDRFEAGGIGWDVLAAPGHDPHSVMLWSDDTGVLISADVLWEHGFGAIFPEIEGDSGFVEEERMLDLIESLAPRAVIPGHGAPFSDVPAALERARARLEALAADPVRNARHVAKVLIKFHLLDVREIELAALRTHFAGARYFQVLHERYFADQPFAAIIDRAVRELVAVRAAEVDGTLLRNRD